MCGCCGRAFSNLFEIMSKEKETPHQVTYDRGHFHCSKQIDKTKSVSIRNICVKYYPCSSWYEFMLMRMIWYEINETVYLLGIYLFHTQICDCIIERLFKRK